MHGKFKGFLSSRVFTRVILVLYSLSALHAQEVEPREELVKMQAFLGSGLSWGVAQEIVYKSSFSDDKESLLVWDVPMSVGPKLFWVLTTPGGFYVRTDVALFLPVATGVMTNSDWDAIPDTSVSTEYSESQNYLTTFFAAGIETGVEVDFNFIKTFWGLEAIYTFVGWEGWNTKHIRTGISGYPPNSYTYGQAIDFRQTWIMPGLKVSINGQWEGFVLGGTFALYPYLFYQARDIHTYRKMTFLDTGLGGNGWALNFNFSYFFLSGWGVRAQWETAYYKTGHVDTIISKNSETSETLAYSRVILGAGGSLGYSNLTLGLVIRLD